MNFCVSLSSRRALLQFLSVHFIQKNTKLWEEILQDSVLLRYHCNLFKMLVPVCGFAIDLFHATSQIT